MSMFGKSFDEKVRDATSQLSSNFPGSKIVADVTGDEVVTLSGVVPNLETKGRVMAAFNDLVKTKNTINTIRISEATKSTPAGMDPVAAAHEPRIHEVVKGDTLSAIAKKYYGNAGKYTKIFEANRDILDDPDRIKVGQKLKIPD
ncbi:MAG: LysM peptidoglycan-binding domain-containing protein [Thermoanaerobaculia bacterium]